MLALAYAPDGRTLAVALEDKSVEVRDVVTGDVRCTLQGIHLARKVAAKLGRHPMIVKYREPALGQSGQAHSGRQPEIDQADYQLYAASQGYLTHCRSASLVQTFKFKATSTKLIRRS